GLRAALDDGWDQAVTARGLTYGCLYGSGHSAINPNTFSMALDAARTYLGGGVSSSPGPAPPGATVPGLGLAPTPLWVTLQQALIFLDWRRPDVPRAVPAICSGAHGLGPGPRRPT